MKINKYFPFAFVYFFINSVALPFGITYTALLAPFFYVWILLKRKTEIVFPFITILTPFIVLQLLYPDIVRKVYFYSLVNLVLVYIFCQAAYTFLLNCKDIEKIFRKLLVINFIFCLGAILLFFTPWQRFVWIEQNLTEGVSNFRRLKLFTYEASYYATLIVPLFCFYMLQFLFRQNVMRGWLLLLMIFLPYILSFSFGVMAALFVSGLMTYMFHFRSLTRKRRIFNSILSTVVVSTLIVFVIYIFFRDSFLVLRLENIYSGNDTSGKGRTYDAFFLANKLLQKRNEYWGVGLGQIKIIGGGILRDYYMYDYYMYGQDFVATIPNAAAETLAVFGWVGFAARLFIEIFFFVYTRAWTNYFRLWLFMFMFIYQFTGSFITNVAEYIIWLLAFTNVFYQFDVRNRKRVDVIPPLQPRVELPG